MKLTRLDLNKKISILLNFIVSFPFLLGVLILTHLFQNYLELIAVGQNVAAVTLLHEIIMSKRARSTPLTSLEPIMLRFVELCVVLKKGKLAKEGLHQYKNISQNITVTSIEVNPEFLCLFTFILYGYLYICIYILLEFRSFPEHGIPHVSIY